MTNSEVRAHLRKGELAVALAEALGYTFEKDPKNPNREVWIAPPVKAEDALLENLREHIEAKSQELGETLARQRIAEEKAKDEQGPNWFLVEPNIGKNFRVLIEKIPSWHPIANFAFQLSGAYYKAENIKYVRGTKYPGYIVEFTYQRGAFGIYSKGSLPLSCAAFQ